MKLYIWEGEGVLEDYTSGMIAVLAESEDEAWRLLQEKDSSAFYSLRKTDKIVPGAELEEWVIRPREVTTPEVFTCWGGG